jgi:hypothetical protein
MTTTHGGAKIHHFGLVVPSIETYLQQSPMWEPRSPIVEDPLQKARLCMIGLVGDGSPAMVELVQPVGDDSPTYRAASKGVVWHHACLSVASQGAGDAIIAQQKWLPGDALEARGAVRRARGPVCLQPQPRADRVDLR